MVACLNIHNFRPGMAEHWSLPFSLPLSFRGSVLWWPRLSLPRQYLKPLSTSARANLVVKSICSFPPTNMHSQGIRSTEVFTWKLGMDTSQSEQPIRVIKFFFRSQDHSIYLPHIVSVFLSHPLSSFAPISLCLSLLLCVCVSLSLCVFVLLAFCLTILASSSPPPPPSPSPFFFHLSVRQYLSLPSLLFPM